MTVIICNKTTFSFVTLQGDDMVESDSSGVSRQGLDDAQEHILEDTRVRMHVLLDEALALASHPNR